MAQDRSDSEWKALLEQTRKEALYYRQVAEETGRRTLRRLEQLETLIAQEKQTEKELAGLLEKVKESNNELSDFTYVASHDLREPLRKITCFGSMLSESLSDSLSEEDAESLEIVIDGARRMQEMIDALLQYSRVTTDAAVFQRVSLHELIRQLQEFELAVLLEERQVVLDVCEPLPELEGDPVQIRQLLQNLVANGVKYQPREGEPRIRIAAQPAGHGMVRVEISDNGIGIEPACQAHVFAMFKRLHPRSEYEGTGVGLAVCRKIVKRHGGQIGVSSELGRGSTFWFTLPAAAPEPACQGA